MLLGVLQFFFPGNEAHTPFGQSGGRQKRVFCFGVCPKNLSWQNVLSVALFFPMNQRRRSRSLGKKVKTNRSSCLQCVSFLQERRCAASLDLDADHAAGTFMCGQTEVNDMTELEPGKLHDITLVLQWCSLKVLDGMYDAHESSVCEGSAETKRLLSSSEWWGPCGQRMNTRDVMPQNSLLQQVGLAKGQSQWQKLSLGEAISNCR